MTKLRNRREQVFGHGFGPSVFEVSWLFWQAEGLRLYHVQTGLVATDIAQ